MSYSVSEIIGTGLRARVKLLLSQAHEVSQGRRSMKVFCSGDAGLGKSMTMSMIRDKVTTEKVACDELIGGQLNADKVRSLIEEMHYTSMFGGRVVWVDEADSMTKGAQVEILKVLDMADNRLGWAFLFTTNQPFSFFEKRFPDRCSQVGFKMPLRKELIEALRSRFPSLPQGDIEKIVDNSASVRSCLINAQDRAELREAMK